MGDIGRHRQRFDVLPEHGYDVMDPGTRRVASPPVPEHPGTEPTGTSTPSGRSGSEVTSARE